jgi:YihY family inner membrane protein
VRAAVVRFLRLAWRANITGLSSMVAYTMLLTVIPVALLALFIAGEILSSASVQASVVNDLRVIFPGAAEHTLLSLLSQIRDAAAGTGVLAIVASVWLGTSFWGALDTAFAQIYGVPARPWVRQKRFGLAMLGVVLVFMIATVAVPTVQTILRSGAADLPFGLSKVTELVYGISLGLSLLLLFATLSVIYSTVPNRRVPWRAVWPGAAGATIAIAIVANAFPVYLSSISTIARFGTTIVFVLIVLLWFYLLALIILGGATVNALRLGAGRASASGADERRED